MILEIDEGVKEVKWSKKQYKKLVKRPGVPPRPAELNEFDPLATPQTYSNFGHDQPYGVGGAANSQLSSGSGNSGVAPSSSGGIGEQVEILFKLTK